ncbi:MAG: L,D-transpeptidase family protein [Candidatus Dormibacteraeota bacterium]|nr:L,D-transpeptidase family protein [Candidatus Dormibacteraeota bacterium]
METAADLAASARRRLTSRPLRDILFGVAVFLIAVLVGAAVFTYQSNQGLTSDQALYQSQLKKLNHQLHQARAEGYSKQDLAPITGGEQQVMGNRAPVAPWSRDSYYQSQAVKVAQLQGALEGLLPEVYANARDTVSQDIEQAQTLLSQNASQGGDVSQLQQQVGQVQQQEAKATTISQVVQVAASAESVIRQATAQAATLKQESQEIQAAANQLLAQSPNLQTLQAAGQTALSNANNDASIAAYQNFGNRFKDFNTLMASYDRLQFFSNQLGSPDINQVAFATAAEQRYGGQIHNILMADLPAQFILVSFQAQHIWAYQNGQVVQDTPVTTGIRGTSTEGTDFGPLQILHKDHPWTMHSPWPKGNPLWYPDTVVQYATFFTWSGEAIHDANWEPDSALGPGSQNDPSFASHGCIHVPASIAAWFYNWSNTGTQMVVFPGDGSPVQNQLGQITTDHQGNPLNPA